MKVYMYYIPENFANTREWKRSKASNILVIYGITDDKEKAKMFESVRDMKVFEKRVEHMCRSDYIEFSNKHRDCVLEKTTLLTHTGYPKSTKIEDLSSTFLDYSIVITFLEKMSIEEVTGDIYKILGEYYNVELLSPKYFTDEFKKALTKLAYDSVYYYQSLDTKGVVDDIDVDTIDKSLNQLSSVDELQVFIFMYGHTLDIELGGSSKK